MSKKLRENRRNLLNLTITEIILIVLFLLMMITAYLVQEKNEFKRQLAEYQQALDQYKKEGIEMAELVELSKINKAIKKYKDGKGEFSVSEISEIINEGILSRDAAQQLKEAKEELAQIKEANKKITAEKKFYEEKYKKVGNDKPPCWPRENDPTNADYLYEAIINSTGIVLKSTVDRYPNRIQERAQLPLTGIVEGVTLQPDDFLKQTNDIKNLSDQKNCRHYILVYDQANNDKAHWKRMIGAIESNFYKYENK